MTDLDRAMYSKCRHARRRAADELGKRWAEQTVQAIRCELERLIKKVKR